MQHNACQKCAQEKLDSSSECVVLIYLFYFLSLKSAVKPHYNCFSAASISALFCSVLFYRSFSAHHDSSAVFICLL